MRIALRLALPGAIVCFVAAGALIIAGLTHSSQGAAATAAVAVCTVGPDDSSLSVTLSATDALKGCDESVRGRAKRGEYWHPKDEGDAATICDVIVKGGGSATVRANLDGESEGRQICAALIADGAHDVTAGGE